MVTAGVCVWAARVGGGGGGGYAALSVAEVCPGSLQPAQSGAAPRRRAARRHPSWRLHHFAASMEFIYL